MASGATSTDVLRSWKADFDFWPNNEQLLADSDECDDEDSGDAESDQSQKTTLLLADAHRLIKIGSTSTAVNERL